MRHQKKFVCASLFLILILITSGAYSQSNVSSLEGMQWVVETGGPVYASPLISEGRLYIGSTDSVFYAIEAGSGKVQWRYHAGNTIQSSAAVYKNLVIFESGNRLLALTRRGRLKWQKDLSAEETTRQMDPWDFHHSSPHLHQGVVYIGTDQGTLLGFEAKSGKQVLRCQTLSELPIRTTPVVSGKLVLYGDWDGVLYANDITNGSLRWKYDTKREGTYPWPNSILSSLVVKQGQVYFAGKSNRLYSLDARTGNKNWHYSSPTDQWLIGGPVLADGVVYLGSSDQHLFHAIDAASGTLIWSADLDGRIWGSATIHNERIYIGSNSLFVLDRETGEIIRKFEFARVHAGKKYGDYIDHSANFHSSPVVFEDLVILGSDDGYIYAIDAL